MKRVVNRYARWNGKKPGRRGKFIPPPANPFRSEMPWVELHPLIIEWDDGILDGIIARGAIRGLTAIESMMAISGLPRGLKRAEVTP